MPIPNRKRDDVQPILSAWEEFEAPGIWRRSPRGNLCRKYDGLSLTIFRRKSDELFGWCIADDDGPRFSTNGFETEDEAIEALGYELGVGE